MGLDIEKYRKKLTEERDSLAKNITNVGATEIAEPISNEHEVTSADAPVIDEVVDVQAAIVNMKSDRLERINVALQSIDEGTYGQCVIGGEEIEPKRLDAEPTATTCIKHAREAEADFKAPQM
jgi:DnaK suppressor protein